MVDQSSVSLPKTILKEVEKIIEKDPFYSSKAEFIKWAIKEKIARENNEEYDKYGIRKIISGWKVESNFESRIRRLESELSILKNDFDKKKKEGF